MTRVVPNRNRDGQGRGHLGPDRARDELGLRRGHPRVRRADAVEVGGLLVLDSGGGGPSACVSVSVLCVGCVAWRCGKERQFIPNFPGFVAIIRTADDADDMLVQTG